MAVNIINHFFQACNDVQKYEQAIGKNSSDNLSLNHTPAALTARMRIISKQLNESYQDEDRHILLECCAQYITMLTNLPNFFDRLHDQLLPLTNKALNSLNEGNIIDHDNKLNEDDVKQIGRLLWKNRSLFTEKRISVLTNNEFHSLSNLKSTVHLLKHSIRESCAEKKTQDFVIQELIERLLPIDLSPELLSHITTYTSSGGETLIDKLALIDDPIISGYQIAQIVNRRKLPLSANIINLPNFKSEILPNLKHLNFKDSTLSDQEILQITIGSSVRELILPKYFNTPIPNEVLARLKTWYMGKAYSHPLPADSDLSNLEEWVMSKAYRHPLPAGLDLGNLQNWVMGEFYDDPLPVGLKLSSLRTWGMSRTYNHPLHEGLDLGNLCTWHMSFLYNQPLPADLDLSSLKTWVMEHSYSHPLPAGLDLSNLQVWIMGCSHNTLTPPGIRPNWTMGWRHFSLFPLDRGMNMDARTWAIGHYNHPLPAGLNLKSLRSWHMHLNYNHPLPAGLDLRNLREWIMPFGYDQLLPEGLDLRNLREWIVPVGYNPPIPEGLKWAREHLLDMVIGYSPAPHEKYRRDDKWNMKVNASGRFNRYSR
ncbi:MAG: hypothetical protein Q8K75_03555 [Chlamydiales bacterium]|nr:hypothetical protein [Chlamydiales bacterium]